MNSLLMYNYPLSEKSLAQIKIIVADFIIGLNLPDETLEDEFIELAHDHDLELTKELRDFLSDLDERVRTEFVMTHALRRIKFNPVNHNIIVEISPYE